MLAEDLPDLDPRGREQLLTRHGWDTTLGMLDDAIADHAQRIPPLEPPARVAVQLALTL